MVVQQQREARRPTVTYCLQGVSEGEGAVGEEA